MIKVLPIKKISFSITATAGIIILLTGCGILLPKPLPDEQRYKYINEVVDAVDLDTVGTIVGGGYDTGDGTFEPSIYRVDVEGKATYDLVNERLKAIPNIKCQDSPEKTQVLCDLGQVDIHLYRKTMDTQNIRFQVLDPFSGRDPK